jgi:hypothetical protein
MDNILTGKHRMDTRRRFLTSSASGLGAIALASMLRDDGLLAQQPANPLQPRQPHFEPRAKACIFVFLIGGISQVDLFDRKPLLQRLHGQQIPESFRRGVRLGQTNYNAPLMAARFGFRRYGRCGLEMTELLPHIGSCADDLTVIRSMHHEAFDHAPGELELCTGKDIPGRPSMGSWLIYGLGSESRNLPGYVVLLNGRSPKARSLVWGNGFLPATYQGVLFRNQGTPILNLQTPRSVSPETHRAQLDAISRLNALRQEETGDPRTAAQIAAYELAFRMQTAAPELLDLSGETRATIESYGTSDFARSLLLARRLVERGVRFVTVTHHEWDHHDAIAAGLPDACRQIDQPIAGLIKDLKRPDSSIRRLSSAARSSAAPPSRRAITWTAPAATITRMATPSGSPAPASNVAHQSARPMSSAGAPSRIVCTPTTSTRPCCISSVLTIAVSPIGIKVSTCV